MISRFDQFNIQHSRICLFDHMANTYPFVSTLDLHGWARRIECSWNVLRLFFEKGFFFLRFVYFICPVWWWTYEISCLKDVFFPFNEGAIHSNKTKKFIKRKKESTVIIYLCTLAHECPCQSMFFFTLTYANVFFEFSLLL